MDIDARLAAMLHITPADVVFDIGSNCGDYLASFASVAKRVVAFEPHPELAENLRYRFAEASNVRIFELAISDSDGMTTFYLDIRPSMSGVASSMLVLDGFKESSPVQIQARKLDTMSALLGIDPTFIKIDAEGAEPQIYEGAIDTIKRCRPKLLFEMWESHYPRFERMFSCLIDQQNYHLVRINDGSEARRYYQQEARMGHADILALPMQCPV